MPRIDALLDRLGGATIMTKFDMTRGVEDVIHGGLSVTSSGQVWAYCSNEKYSYEMSL